MSLSENMPKNVIQLDLGSEALKSEFGPRSPNILDFYENLLFHPICLINTLPTSPQPLSYHEFK